MNLLKLNYNYLIFHVNLCIIMALLMLTYTFTVYLYA